MNSKLQLPVSILCGALSVACGADSSQPKTPLPKLTRPNVILIVVDDLGWKDLGCMGSTFYETPTIDRLANEGALFTNGYASSSVSSPSRGSIITGKTPTRHGITSWIGDPEGELWREKGHVDPLMPASYAHNLDTMEYSIASAFADNGYTTIFSGKWHLGDDVLPTDFGFDINIGGWEAGGPRGGYFSPYENPMLKDGHVGENLTERLSGEAIMTINRMRHSNNTDPFFLMLSFYAVHAPLQTTYDLWSKYSSKAFAQGLTDVEEGFDDYGSRLPSRINQDNPVYAGLLESVDTSVGNLVSFLEYLGELDNTIILFTSDNGGVVAGDDYSTSLRPLRGGKGMQWEGGTRVPFIIRYPGATPQVIDEPVINMDIYPTLLDLAGLAQKPEQHVDGVSVKPLLENDRFADRSLYWHFPHYGNQGGEPCSIIRDGDWKLIYFHEDQRMELYNLADDISEDNNLADAEPKRVEKMRKELDGFLSETNAKMPTPDPTYTKEAGDKWNEERFEKQKSYRERLRREQYSSKWEPNRTWWGTVEVQNKK